MKADNDNFLKNTLGFCLCTLSIFYWPVVVQDGWAWHIVPLGVAVIGYGQAWGIGCLVAFVTHQSVVDPGESDNILMSGTKLIIRIAASHGVLWLTS